MGSSSSRQTPVLDLDQNNQTVHLPPELVSFPDAEATARSQIKNLILSVDKYYAAVEEVYDELEMMHLLWEKSSKAAKNQSDIASCHDMLESMRAIRHYVRPRDGVTRIYKYPSNDINGLERWSLTTTRPFNEQEIALFQLAVPLLLGITIASVSYGARSFRELRRARVSSRSWKNVSIALARKSSSLTPCEVKKIIADSTQEYGVKELGPEWQSLMQESVKLKNESLLSKPAIHGTLSESQGRTFSTSCSNNPSRILSMAPAFRTKTD